MEECENIMEVAEGPSFCLDKKASQPAEVWHGLKAFVDQPFEQVLSNTKAAAQSMGMLVVAETDVKQMFLDRLGIVYPKYVILGILKPEWVHKTLDFNRDLGSSVPVSMAIYEQEGGTNICVTNPYSCTVADLGELSAEIRAALQALVEKSSGVC